MVEFRDVICKNIDQLAEAAHRSRDQGYVDRYLDTFFAFSERVNGRSGLEPRCGRRDISAPLTPTDLLR